MCVRIYRVFREKTANPQQHDQRAGTSDGTGVAVNARRLSSYLNDDLIVGDAEGV